MYCCYFVWLTKNAAIPTYYEYGSEEYDGEEETIGLDTPGARELIDASTVLSDLCAAAVFHISQT